MRNFLYFLILFGGLILAGQVAGVIFGAPPASRVDSAQLERVQWAGWMHSMMNK